MKICPLLFLKWFLSEEAEDPYIQSLTEKIESSTKCLKSNCIWWNEEEDNCSIMKSKILMSSYPVISGYSDVGCLKNSLKKRGSADGDG